MPVISGGGGAGPVLAATVTLTDAEIKALPTTGSVDPFGFPIVAGIAGSLLVPIAFSFALRGFYTNLDAAMAMQVAYSGFDGLPVSATISRELFVSGNEGVVSPVTYWQNLTADHFPATGAGTPLTDLDGAGLILWVGNGAAGDFTGGDPANTLKVSTVYAAVPL